MAQQRIGRRVELPVGDVKIPGMPASPSSGGMVNPDMMKTIELVKSDPLFWRLLQLVGLFLLGVAIIVLALFILYKYGRKRLTLKESIASNSKKQK
jgi:hypothetical protein